MYVYTHFVIMSKLQESLTKIGISLIEKWDSLTDSFGQGIRSYTRRINGKKQKKKRLLENMGNQKKNLDQKNQLRKVGQLNYMENLSNKNMKSGYPHAEPG